MPTEWLSKITGSVIFRFHIAQQSTGKVNFKSDDLLASCDQASLRVFCACECRSVKNVPAEKIKYGRWPDADFEEKCLQKCQMQHFVHVSSAWCLS